MGTDSALATRTRVVNIGAGAHFDVYIVKGKWRNPFRLGRDGTRAEVAEKYRGHLLGSPLLMRQIGELKGKTLGCYCAPEPCHGHILAELADAAK